MSILTPDIADFKTRDITRGKKRTFHYDKGVNASRKNNTPKCVHAQ